MAASPYYVYIYIYIYIQKVCMIDIPPLLKITTVLGLGFLVFSVVIGNIHIHDTYIYIYIYTHIDV